jgi:hypothetical protein
VTIPEFISTEVCGTVLVLGGAAIGVGCAALRGHWARFSVSFAAVPKGKRWGMPIGDAGAAAGVADGAGTDPAPSEAATLAAGPTPLPGRRAS